MTKFNLLAAFGIFLLILSLSNAAGCSARSYAESCAKCSFDANGKMNQTCYNEYKSSGVACVAATYPIASAKYGAGQCPGIDSCSDQLLDCTRQYESGNDQDDCQEGSVAVCFAAADQCVRQAAVKCGEMEQQCPGSSAAIVLPFLLAGFAAFYTRR